MKGRIKIGNRDCELLSLRNSDEATCKTPSSGRIKEKPVSLFLPRQGKIQSIVRFRYEDFDIHGFAPSKGPMSGGTIVTVRGYNLDIGRKSESSLMI